MGQERPPFRLCRVSPRLAHGGSRQRPTDSDGEYGRCFVGCIGRNGASCGGSDEDGGRGRRAGPPHADAGHSLCASLHVGQGARGILQRRPWLWAGNTQNRQQAHEACFLYPSCPGAASGGRWMSVLSSPNGTQLAMCMGSLADTCSRRGCVLNARPPFFFKCLRRVCA